jgi:hypothetical protein
MLKKDDPDSAPKRGHGARRRNKVDSEKTAAVAGGTSNNRLLKFFAQRGGRFVIRKMTIHVGSFELHNITTPGEQQVVDVNQTWTLTDVRSRKEVVDFVTGRLQNYGIGVMIQNVFGAIFNLPGVKSINSAMAKVSHLGRGMFRKVSETMMQTLPDGGAAVPAGGSKDANAEGSDSRSTGSKKGAADLRENSDNVPLIEQVRSVVKFDDFDGVAKKFNASAADGAVEFRDSDGD